MNYKTCIRLVRGISSVDPWVYPRQTNTRLIHFRVRRAYPGDPGECPSCKSNKSIAACTKKNWKKLFLNSFIHDLSSFLLIYSKTSESTAYKIKTRPILKLWTITSTFLLKLVWLNEQGVIETKNYRSGVHYFHSDFY